jgi:hypothetical protein
MMFPRLALAVMWFVGYSGHAFATMIWPLLGFFFMPYTTAAYAIAINEWGEVRGLGLALIIVAVVFDLGGHGSSAATHRRYRSLRY